MCFALDMHKEKFKLTFMHLSWQHMHNPFFVNRKVLLYLEINLGPAQNKFNLLRLWLSFKETIYQIHSYLSLSKNSCPLILA